MSSSEGLDRLKNWQRAEKALVSPSISWKGTVRIFEVRVKVLSVDDSTLTLSILDSPGETRTIDIRDAAFSSTADVSALDLQLILADGGKLYLREEDESQ